MKRLKKLLKRLLALVPGKLPSGMTEFNVWADEVIDLYNAPNNDSVRFTLAVMILHLPATTAYKSKEYFGRSLLKTAANQVVSQIIQDLKAKQAAEQAKSTEATVLSDSAKAASGGLQQ